ncbi:hypothetical protein MTR67_046556 [Solanum verrucosum]|uniref:ADP-ribosyl cyclase/cyclic ADP-ribose hydrolase n=1 Tax=Solanum verrucosum TaxID=315347 RepID=A0AAF0UY47_SOLVR|nr:hypothetical protein MTR67_046556 [Solanum verrucosum]
MKVLIVLDDIDHGDHLEYLAGDVGWFGNGSRVIVTTRNRHLIEKDNAIYEVPTLPDDEAMQLFNKHAFKKEVPNECCKKLSLEVVNQAKGLPLALKVWGSLLHKKDLIQWRRMVDQIKKNSSSEIVEKLKISYDGLEPEEQKIFLDIACFFRGHKRKEVMQIVDSCDFGAEYGLDVLIDKSLVFISKYDRIEMHDLIEDMGKYILKMQKDSGKPSRIWNVEDFEDVMVDNMGTMAMEAIWFMYFGQLSFNKEAMKNMKMLRILCICTEDDVDRMTSFSSDTNCHDDSIEYLSNNLRCICKFKGLVKLFVSECSKLVSLPGEIGDLQNLENLNATYTLISRPPSSIVRLNKHEFLSFGQPRSEDGVFFVFPQNISSLQHDIYASDSLSLRVLRSRLQNIPSWFRHQGMDTSVSVNLPVNWYVSDNFLGFAVCYSGRFIDDITAHLIPLCDDGMSSMTQKFALSNHSEYMEKYAIHFLLIPLGGLWDASNANGKTPMTMGALGYIPLEK